MPKKKASKAPKKITRKVSRRRHVGYGAISGVFLVVLFILYLGFNNIKRNSITSFEECISVGGAVMESYPRQCEVKEKTFVESTKTPPFEIIQIKKGTNEISLQFPRGNYIINSPEEWDVLFGESGIVPDVDFNEKTVIAVIMGQKPSGGYSVGLKQIEVTEDRIEFMVNETIPGESCIVTEALTNPYQIIAIQKVNYEIKFLGNTIVSECE